MLELNPHFPKPKHVIVSLSNDIFASEKTVSPNLTVQFIDKRIYECQHAGRFRELHQWIDLWNKTIGNPHELTQFANDVFAFVVDNNIQDNEIEAYISLAKMVAKENCITISSNHLKISLLSDEFSKWIDYHIMLPEKESVNKVFKMNLHLVDDAKKISKPVRQYMVVMFR
jgi:hypothetical protein